MPAGKILVRESDGPQRAILFLSRMSSGEKKYPSSLLRPLLENDISLQEVQHLQKGLKRLLYEQLFLGVRIYHQKQDGNHEDVLALLGQKVVERCNSWSTFLGGIEKSVPRVRPVAEVFPNGCHIPLLSYGLELFGKIVGPAILRNREVQWRLRLRIQGPRYYRLQVDPHPKSPWLF